MRRWAGALQPLNRAAVQSMVRVEPWEEDGLTQRPLIQRLDVEQDTTNSTLNRMNRDRLGKENSGRLQTVYEDGASSGLN